MLSRSHRSRALLALAACVLFTASPGGQNTALTIGDVDSYAGWTRFNGNQSARMTWVPDGGPWISDDHYLWPVEQTGSADASWQRIDAVTGHARPLVRHAQVEAALVSIGVSSADAQRASRVRPAIFSRSRDAFLLAIGDDLFTYNLSTEAAARLTRSPGAKREATYSPDGSHVAYIKDNDIFVTSVQNPAERRVTLDGAPRLLNGVLDWVYSEELYGRGNHRGYWWSGDSSRIAFLQLNEAAVPDMSLVDELGTRPRIDSSPYPKAGDPNPVARLGIIDLQSAATRWVDTSKYKDFLIVSVTWSPDGRHVVYQVQDRTQTWLDLNKADARTGATATLLRETSHAWVERWQDPSVDPMWVQDGSFLWMSERTGWRHIYHYTSDGALIRPLTSGEWEVRHVHGIDRPGGSVYVSGTARSALDLDLIRVPLKGGNAERTTSVPGRHQVFLNPARTMFLDSWSDVSTPPQVRLFRTDTPNALRVVDANPVQSLDELGLSKPEFLQVKSRDGFAMEAVMIKPRNFDASKKYPVYQFAYGGPHFQSVLNSWGFSDFMYHQILAQHGIIVWMCDNRTASGKGMQSAWPAYKNLGETELADIEDCLSWLKRQPYVDSTRIGIAGASYGAYLTLYALTHSRSFVMGIAEGAVSDWRNYDTIYTERYLGLPHENPDAYRRSSPLFKAGALAGNLLLIHSSMDDNVHPQNAIQFAHELQRAGKPFRMMIYPTSTHGVSSTSLAAHFRQLILDFTTQNLLR